MYAYYEESGNPNLRKNGLFTVFSIWTDAPHNQENFMRRWHKELRMNGYTGEEIKGHSLTIEQRSRACIKMKSSFNPSFRADVVVLHMNSLISDHRLFHPRSWTENEIHQALLYYSMSAQIGALPDHAATILVDRRHTLPNAFFIRAQSRLRKQFRAQRVSVNGATSHEQKNIQLADVLCNQCYHQINSKARGHECDVGELLRTSITVPLSVKVMNAPELVSVLTEFQEMGDRI